MEVLTVEQSDAVDGVYVSKEIEADTQEETDDKSGGTVEHEETQHVSKRQLKRLAKREKWLQTRKERREKERNKLKQKRAAMRELDKPPVPGRKALKKSTMSQSNCNIKVAVDLSFDHLMNDRDLGKCTKQIMRCYSLNRRSANPLQFHVTSFNGRSKDDMSKNVGHAHWDVNFNEAHYADVFPKESIVYLSSESENTVDELKPDSVYVIGGLVDHNLHKGLCHKTAVEKGFQHARLPIDEYLEMKTRKVLSIDHVFEIILGVCQGLSWQEALLRAIPLRKGAVAKDNTINDDNTEDASS